MQIFSKTAYSPRPLATILNKNVSQQSFLASSKLNKRI